MRCFLLWLSCCLLFSCSSQEPVFHDTEGNTVTLSQLKGKWVVINYWAAWCDNCMAEIQELNQFYQHQHQNQVELYSVNYDSLPSTQQLKTAIDNARIQFPTLTTDPSQSWHLGDITAIPMTFIINPDGKVVKAILGPNTDESLSTTLDGLKYAAASS